MRRTPYIVDLLLAWGADYMSDSIPVFHDSAVKMTAAYVRKGFVSEEQALQAKEYGYSDWFEAYVGGLSGFTIENFLLETADCM